MSEPIKCAGAEVLSYGDGTHSWQGVCQAHRWAGDVRANEGQAHTDLTMHRLVCLTIVRANDAKASA